MFDRFTAFYWGAIDVLQTYNGAVTALATMFIAVFTVVLAIVSRKQAILTRQSVQIAERALISTERAFVFVEDFVPDFSFTPRQLQINYFRVKPRWRNNGTTPTKDMTVSVNWTHWPGESVTGIGIYPEGRTKRMFLAPQAVEWSEAVEIPAEVATQALQGKQKLFIWGRVDYDDIFDGTSRHFTEWCYQIHIFESGGRVDTQFVAFSDYNRSDDGKIVKR